MAVARVRLLRMSRYHECRMEKAPQATAKPLFAGSIPARASLNKLLRRMNVELRPMPGE